MTRLCYVIAVAVGPRPANAARPGEGPESEMFEKDELLKESRTRLAAVGPSTFGRPILPAVALFVSLLIWNPAAASAAASACVVKLQVSSNGDSDGGTKAFVTQVLTGQGYKIIDDWLFTMWRASDYDVKIVMTYSVTAELRVSRNADDNAIVHRRQLGKSPCRQLHRPHEFGGRSAEFDCHVQHRATVRRWRGSETVGP